MLLKFGGEKSNESEANLILDLIANKKIKKGLTTTLNYNDTLNVLPISIIYGRNDIDKKHLFTYLSDFKKMFVDRTFFLNDINFEGYRKYFIQFICNNDIYYFEIIYNKEAILLEKLQKNFNNVYIRKCNKIELSKSLLKYKNSIRGLYINLINNSLDSHELFLLNGFKNIVCKRTSNKIVDYIVYRLVLFDLTHYKNNEIEKIVNENKIFIISNFDNEMSYFETDKLITAFKNQKDNNSHAQLIFSSNNPYILLNEKIRLDEVKVFFEYQESKKILCSFNDIKNRENLIIRNNRDLVKCFISKQI